MATFGEALTRMQLLAVELELLRAEIKPKGFDLWQTPGGSCMFPVYSEQMVPLESFMLAVIGPGTTTTNSRTLDFANDYVVGEVLRRIREVIERW
jgi:hypothetical protein